MILYIKKYSLLFMLLSFNVIRDFNACTANNLDIVGDETLAKGKRNLYSLKTTILKSQLYLHVYPCYTSSSGIKKL